MWERLKLLLGIRKGDSYEDEIICGLRQEVRGRNLFFHLFIIAFELIMMVSISLRPGGPFAKPRRVAYFLLYLILIIGTAGVTLAEAWIDKKKGSHRLYFKLENIYLVFFCFWGIAITLNDQLGGNGLTVYNYVILIMAIMCMMEPWKAMLLIFVNFVLLNALLPYFPDPNGLDNTYNNFVNSAFLSLAAFAIAMNLYNSKRTAKRDEIIIKKQYQQIRDINGLLKEEAMTDVLTGLRNRNSYNKVLQGLRDVEGGSLTCIYIDVNGLHEINNRLGHDAGDEMLKAVADILLENFKPDEVFRIGGDEFVVLCRNIGREMVKTKLHNLAEDIGKKGYSLSVGWEAGKPGKDICGLIRAAETAMQKNKQAYYLAGGDERQMRILNKRTESLMSEKRDAEQFLSVLAPAFKGAYFVNLETDMSRHLFIPDYFEGMLKEAHDKFSIALMLYARRMVKPEFEAFFEEICDYGKLRKMLEEDGIPGFLYEKTDGSRLKLQILDFRRSHHGLKETLWIFSDLDADDII